MLMCTASPCVRAENIRELEATVSGLKAKETNNSTREPPLRGYLDIAVCNACVGTRAPVRPRAWSRVQRGACTGRAPGGPPRLHCCY